MTRRKVAGNCKWNRAATGIYFPFMPEGALFIIAGKKAWFKIFELRSRKPGGSRLAGKSLGADWRIRLLPSGY